MNTFKTLEFLKERERPIYKHGLVGLLIGYSFFHPLTMIIYYFEHHGLPSDFFQTISKITILIGLSFSAKMLPMAGLLALTGGLMGMFLRLCHKHDSRPEHPVERARKKAERANSANRKAGHPGHYRRIYRT